MTDLVIRADGVEIATQSFGNPAQPPILLIMGGMASMLWWPDEFCRQLAAPGRFVIRYDQRDTGHSTKYPPVGRAMATTTQLMTPFACSTAME
jgi:pimeloyl-ACP methyl ester carboxylesterase